jgi:aspartate kinase
MIIVSKFGGTSVKDAAAIERLARIIEGKKVKTVVVVSAMATVTDSFVSLVENLRSGKLKKALQLLNDIFLLHKKTAEELKLGNGAVRFLEREQTELEQLFKALNVLGEVSPKSSDMIIATGERLSAYLVSEAIRLHGLDSVLFETQNVIRTDSAFGEAEVDLKATKKLINKKLLPEIKKHKVVVCGGFIASDKNGNITTLGRGGSDYSAAIIAASIEAAKLEIWTDVSGIMTADPRFIKDARVIKELSYTEAAELSYFGAKVLHPKTIQPAISEEIPVYVLNSSKPEHPGTKIVSNGAKKKIIKAIAFRKSITIIKISSNRMLGTYGFLKRVFDVFDKYETSVDIVTTSEVSVSLTIDDDKNLSKIKKDLKRVGEVEIRKNYGVICAVGEGIRDTAGVAARFFGVLNGINILMVSIGASEVNISIIVKEKDIENSLKLLHKEFFDGVIDESVFY